MRRIIKPTIVIILLVVGAMIFLTTVGNNKTQAEECSGVPPIGDSIHFVPLFSSAPPISQSAAVQTATANSSVDVSGAEITNAQFVSFSDDARGKANSIGDDDSIVLDYQNVPAWVVTFCGVHPPMFLPFDSNDPRMTSLRTAQTHEWNVVVNAQTGTVMEEYSIR